MTVAAFCAGTDCENTGYVGRCRVWLGFRAVTVGSSVLSGLSDCLVRVIAAGLPGYFGSRGSMDDYCTQWGKGPGKFVRGEIKE